MNVDPNYGPERVVRTEKFIDKGSNKDPNVQAKDVLLRLHKLKAFCGLYSLSCIQESEV